MGAGKFSIRLRSRSTTSWRNDVDTIKNKIKVEKRLAHINKKVINFTARQKENKEFSFQSHCSAFLV